MELIKVISARNTIDELSDKGEMGAHLAYWMTKFITNTDGEYNFYVNEMRKIVNKYSDKEDENFVIPKENLEKFNNEVETLNKTDVEAPNIKFSLSELSAELKLSMKQIYPLLDFIDENK